MSVSAILLVFTLTAAAVVYGPLLSGYFIGDDFLHLYASADAYLSEYLLRPHGGHVLIARNAAFVAFFRLFGMNAEPYFWAVLATHLLNTYLLFRVIENWTDNTPLAALGAFLWSVCPVHAGTLSWYSVYGQALVATLLLFVLHQASRHEARQMPLPRATIAIWPLLFILASVCFGVGIGLTLIAPVAVYFLLPPSRLRLALCAVLAIIAALTPTLYQAIIIYHDTMVGSTQAGWAMAMSIGALQYRVPILMMFGYLLNYSASSLLLGFASTAETFPSIATTLAAVAYLTVVAFAIVRASRRRRLLFLGLLLLAVGCYGVIAAGRATLLPVHRVAFSASMPRYHYVGMMPLSILLSCALAELVRASRHAHLLSYGILVVAVATSIILFARAKPFIDPHLEARKETLDVVEQLRRMIANAPADAEVQIPNRPFASVGPLLRDFRSGFPGWAGIFTLFFPSNVVDGKRVRFVINDAALLPIIATGKRSHDLFVVAPAPAAAKPRTAF